MDFKEYINTQNIEYKTQKIFRLEELKELSLLYKDQQQNTLNELFQNSQTNKTISALHKALSLVEDKSTKLYRAESGSCGRFRTYRVS